MKNKQINYNDLQEQHLDVLIKLAFQHEDAIEAQENNDAENDEYPVDETRKSVVWDMAMDRFANQEKEEKKKNQMIQIRHAIPRVIQIAACIVLLIGIAAPFAIAHVEAIRIRVMELLIDIQEDHTELNFVEDVNVEFTIPAEWTGLYYPAYVPTGFTLVEISLFSCEATFSDGNGDFIYFGEYTEDDSVDINSENAVLSYTTVNGANTFVIEREDCVILTWCAEDRFFVIIADTSLEEALKMAQSFRRISFSK